MLVAKKKKVTAKEKNSRQKKITYGEKKKIAAKEKIVAAKEGNSQKKTTKCGKRSREKHH